NDQVDFILVGLKDLQSMNPVFCKKDAIAGTFQNGSPELANEGLVVHEQDGFVSARSHLQDRPYAALRLMLRAGKINVESRSLADFAVAIDPAAVLLDDAEDHGQPQAGLLARPLGGEK